MTSTSSTSEPTTTSSTSTSTWSSTNVGALTTPYTPTWTGDCNTLYLAANDLHTWLQRGGPGEGDQQACLPTGWIREAMPYYSPGICPSGFSIATQGEANGVSTATCCPTEYNARLTATSVDKNICSSFITAQSSESILSTNFDSGEEATTTLFTFTGGTYVGARGVVIQRQDTDPPWDSTSSPTSSPSGGDSTTTSPIAGDSGGNENGAGGGGLTTGAKAGIGVGVSLGVLLILSIIFAAFRIGRVRRQEHHHQQQPSSSMEQQQQQQYQQAFYGGASSNLGGTPTEVIKTPVHHQHQQDWTPSEPYRPIHELATMGSPTELESNRSAATELEGDVGVGGGGGDGRGRGWRR